MNKKLTIILLAIISIIFIFTIIKINKNKMDISGVNESDESNTSSKNLENNGMTQKDEMQDINEESEKMQKESMIDEENSLQTDITSVYMEYNQTNLKKAQEKGKVVLFFFANWCPTCKTADSDFKNNFSELPKNVTVLIVDYDKETALKQKYGVTYQHTFVQIDQTGNELAKWNGGGVKTLIQNIK